MTRCKCGREKALFVGENTRKEVCMWCSMSAKAKREFKKIDEEVEKDLQPLYNSLGVDMETESLYWMNNEVYVINKKTGKRREIEGKTQRELNITVFKNALLLGKKLRGEKFK